MPNFLFRNTGNLRFAETVTRLGYRAGGRRQSTRRDGHQHGRLQQGRHLDLVWPSPTWILRCIQCIAGSSAGCSPTTAIESGVGYPTLPFVGFGVAFLDFDNDAQLDIAIANGHILDNAPRVRTDLTYAQRKLLFRNGTMRRFTEVGRMSVPAFAAMRGGAGAGNR